MAGPYGQIEELTLYIQKASDNSEKQFTDIMGEYDIDLTLDKSPIFTINMAGLEEADKAYIDTNNLVFAFSGMKLMFVGRIQQINYGNDQEVTLIGEELGVAKLLDRTTGVLRFQNIDTCAINSCLLCTGGSNIISMGTNTNFGKISFRNENDSAGVGLSKVASGVSYDWWTSYGNSTCQCSTGPGFKTITDGNTTNGWVALLACDVGIDTGNKKEGYSSVTMGGTSATFLIYTYTIPQANTVVPYNQFQWWMYVDNIACFTTNVARVCLYKAADNEGYFVDLACSGFSNGWNNICALKSNFTASGAASWDCIDTMRVIWSPCANCAICLGCLKMDYFVNYEYCTQYYNTDTARGSATTIINCAEATTCWSAICVGDSVAATALPAPKCGTNSITFVKAQTSSAVSEYQLCCTATCNFIDRSLGFWFYLDCTTCTSIHTTAPLKYRVSSDNFTGYKEWTWDCKDLMCGWNLLLVDEQFPENVTSMSTVNDKAIDRMRWLITTCAAGCTIAACNIMVDHVVHTRYGFSLGSKFSNALGISNQKDNDSLANKVIILGSGDGNNQICSISLGATLRRSCLCNGESSLCENITATATAIGLFDTTGYPATGCVCIDAECASYGSKTATCLCSVTRGLNSTCCLCHTCLSSALALNCLEVFCGACFAAGPSCVCIGRETVCYTSISTNFLVLSTTVARGVGSTCKYAHGKCIEVYDSTFTCTSCQAGSSIACFGLHEIAITCPGILDQNLADRTAQVYMLNRCSPPQRIILEPSNFDFLTRVDLGDAVIVDDQSSCTQGTFRVVRIRAMNDQENGQKYQVELSNKRIEIVEELQRRSCQINENLQYMQGATNIYQLQADDNVDQGFGTVLKYYLPADVKGINASCLSYDVSGYRTYSQTTGSCPDGTITYVALSQDVENTSVTGCICTAVVFTPVGDVCCHGTFQDNIWMMSYGNNHGSSQAYCFQICDVTGAANIMAPTTCTLANNAIALIVCRDTTNRAGRCVRFIACCAFINDERYVAHQLRTTHCHNTCFGILDTGSTICCVTLFANGTDCTACYGTLSTTQQNDINLLCIPQLQTRGQWHCVEIRPGPTGQTAGCGRGRIRTNLYQKVYIESCT
jgi:hypothetical protein